MTSKAKIAILGGITLFILLVWFLPRLIGLLFGILGILLLALVLVLLCPLGTEVWYNSELETEESLILELSFLIFGRKRVKPFYKKPAPPKVKKERQEKPREEKPKKEFPQVSSDDIAEGLRLLSELLPTFGQFMRKLLWQIKIWDFDMAYGVCGGDAAETAIGYGNACLLLMPVLTVFAEFCQVTYRVVDIFPDFTNASGKSRLYLHFKARVIPLLVLGVVLVLVIKLFPFLKQMFDTLTEKEG